MDNQPAKHIRVTVSLPPEALDKLDRVAKETGRTRSNAVARLIALAAEPK